MKSFKEPILLLLFACVLACGSAATAQSGRADLISGALSEDAVRKSTEKEQTGNRVYSGVKLQWLEQAVDPDEYVLGPYDRLLVNITGPEPKAIELVVLPEGYVFFPGVGGIFADGLTMTRFREVLSDEIDMYFKNIEVFCYLQQPRVFRVYVTGEVADPGAVEVTAVQRVSDAIELAGSINSKGSNRRVQLCRGEDTLSVDILKFVLEGDFSRNPFLSNGDRIHVPVADIHTVVRGSVNRSSVYEMLPEETVLDIIRLAGGFSGEAFSDTILLSRVEDDGSVLTVPVPESEFGTTVLRDRDEINVMDGMTGTSRVYVFGATQKTGHYYITEGEGLTDLLARVGQFQPDVDFRAASIERMNGEIIRLDLRDYIPPTQTRELSLKNGDMLHIPAISKMVAVGGEVQLPGKFSYEGDWTVAQYVGLAGGPTENGSVDRVVIYSSDGQKRNGNGGTRPNRGDVIIVKRSKAKIFGSIFSSFVTMGTVILSIIVLTK
ncbi:MAG: SLBB domain-containing protein [Candidatus Krumholzibacteria bacterium]|nr:SLBB domain-containing protein [Candidatus Krumholzibacteria bacterium]